jgi:hypothetical protein
LIKEKMQTPEEDSASDKTDTGPLIPEITTYTINDAIEYCGLGPFQFLMLFITGLSWAADAMELLLIGFVLPILARQWGVDEITQAPFIASASFVVCF